MVVFAKGHCSLSMFGQIYPCKALVYQHIAKNGRTSFGANTTVGLISFSGDADLQPAIDLYILKVDSILDVRGDSPERTPANGSCKADVSADGNYIKQVTCSAHTEFGQLLLNFRGNGSRINKIPLPYEGTP
jgi:hypothetical protein